MGQTFKNRITSFRPRLRYSVPVAILFGGVALVSVISEAGQALPMWLRMLFYVAAAISIGLTGWATVRLFCSGAPQKAFYHAAHRFALTGRLVDETPFRILFFARLSAAVNILFALFKGISGWLTSSMWLIAFAGYYIVLCLAKLMLLSANRSLAALPPTDRILREWKAYRLCGLLLLLLTLLLQSVVVMIVERGNGFSYAGYLIYVMALYDFYCLISAICYIIKNRRNHTPTVVAIKLLSFSASLVSILSLQTAMFAAFGSASALAVQSTMNLATGTGVCLMLLALSLYMVGHAGMQICGLAKP